MEDLKARFAELKPRYYTARQRFTLPPREGSRSGEALADGKRLVADYGLADGSVLFFKDLGPQVGGESPGREPLARQVGRAAQLPVLKCSECRRPPLARTGPSHAHHASPLPRQIGYATVFFWEYFGPLMVYPLFYMLPQIFYFGIK